MYYEVNSQLYLEMCKYELTEEPFDNDEDWQNLKLKKESSLQEENLEKRDLSFEEISKLNSESEFDKKATALERAFFGNDILYEKFKSLIAKDPKKGHGLAYFKSEFFRWLIKNFRGYYENPKKLVYIYQSKKNFPMYVLWKSIAMANNFPVGRE